MANCIRCGEKGATHKGMIYEIGLHGNKRKKGMLCNKCNIISGNW